MLELILKGHHGTRVMEYGPGTVAARWEQNSTPGNAAGGAGSHGINVHKGQVRNQNFIPSSGSRRKALRRGATSSDLCLRNTEITWCEKRTESSSEAEPTGQVREPRWHEEEVLRAQPLPPGAASKR